MSTYCKTAISISDDVDSQTLLTKLAIECFGAREAVPVDSRQYVIDAGMNDVRAVVNEEKSLIAFCCRYKNDVPKTEEKIQRFAQAHGVQLTTL